jgi:hypothetical protein
MRFIGIFEDTGDGALLFRSIEAPNSSDAEDAARHHTGEEFTGDDEPVEATEDIKFLEVLTPEEFRNLAAHAETGEADIK